MARFELHYSSTKTGAPAIHAAGCLHGRPDHIKVEPLEGATSWSDARQHPLCQDHDENVAMGDTRYTVKVAPCATRVWSGPFTSRQES